MNGHDSTDDGAVAGSASSLHHRTLRSETNGHQVNEVNLEVEADGCSRTPQVRCTICTRDFLGLHGTEMACGALGRAQDRPIRVAGSQTWGGTNLCVLAIPGQCPGLT